MRSRRTLLAAVTVSLAPAISLVAPGLAGAAPASGAVAVAPDPVEPCAGFGAVSSAGEIADGELVELSGLAASRVHPGVMWGHNDSGDAARVFALDESGAALGTYSVPDAGAVDWEDMAVGPGPDQGTSYLYPADIGDNNAARTDGVTVYRVPEPPTTPDGSGGELAGAVALELRYPDGPSDAEALLVDPVSGDLVIVTKSLIGSSVVLSAPAAALDGDEPVTLEQQGTLQVPLAVDEVGLPGTMVTGGDVAPDGSIVLLRTYQTVLAFDRQRGTDLAAALATTPCSAPAAPEAQGEAVAFTSDGAAYLTASEVQGAVERGEVPPGTRPVLSRVALDTPRPPVTTTAAPTTTAASTSTPSTSTPAVDSTAPGTEAPGTEAPGTEAPATEAPTSEAPASDAPTTDAPVAGPESSPSTSAPDDDGGGGSGAALAALVVVLLGGGLWLWTRQRSAPTEP